MKVVGQIERDTLNPYKQLTIDSKDKPAHFVGSYCIAYSL